MIEYIITPEDTKASNLYYPRRVPRGEEFTIMYAENFARGAKNNTMFSSFWYY